LILDTKGNIRFKPEIAWNYGLSFMQGFKSADVGFDFYRTDFQNQVVDVLQSPQQVLFIT
jgi:hypothetical protein